MSEQFVTNSSEVATEVTDNKTPLSPEAQQLIEAPSLGFELPPTTANGETTKEQDNKLVADELARLIGAEGTNSDQSREDLLAYIREIMSDEESPYPFERAVISELLAKNQRYKLCNEIADTSNHLIDELTSENISSSENRLTLCDDIKERMNGAPLAGISGLIPDHKEFVGIRLGTDYNSAMKGYEKLRIRASKRRDDIEGLEIMSDHWIILSRITRISLMHIINAIAKLIKHSPSQKQKANQRAMTRYQLLTPRCSIM